MENVPITERATYVTGSLTTMGQNEQPWISGPAEVLRHGFDLLREDSGTNRRLALIAVDNAVELLVKTYLSLPKRVTGLSVPRKRLEEVSESFPALLDALEEFAARKLDGVDLASIEWYHRLRNQLYHQGYGLSVEREKVEIYAELANALFKNLFGTTVIAPTDGDTRPLGRFVQLWPRLEAALASIASDHSVTGRPHKGSVLDTVRYLRDGHIVPEADLADIERLRKIRNEVVHGVVDYKQVLDQNTVDRLEKLVLGLETIGGIQ
jgi:hypothetical protein